MIGADGQEYGPAGVDALREWAQQNRVLPTTILKNAATGERVAASAVPGIFPQAAGPAQAPQQDWSRPPSASPYPRGPQYPPATGAGSGEGIGYLGWAIGRSIIALVFFFVLHGIGLIIAGYGVYYAIQSHQNGQRFSVASMAISIVTFVIIGIGWLLRMGHVI